MELAAAQGFEIRVVTLPPGQDPADAPEGFEDRLGAAESYLHYRVRLELDRASDRQEGFVRAREILAKAEDSPERQAALRLLADRLDLPKETLSGIAPHGEARRRAVATTTGRSVHGWSTPATASSGTRSRRCSRTRSCTTRSGSCREDHFDDEAHRRFRAYLLQGGEPDGDLVALRAELDARADREGITRRTGTELLLRLRERKLRRDLHGETDLARTTELQAHLAKVRQALVELA